jgi:putative peptidoglycan lipid II flippase
VLVSVLIFTFAPACVRINAYGFIGERSDLAVTLTRYLVIAGLSTILVGPFTRLFQAEKQFFIPAFVAFISNALIVLSLYLLHSSLGIHSWTVGQVLLATVQFGILFLFLHLRYKFFRTLSYHQVDWKEISRFALLLFSLVISGGLSILNQVVDKTIASGLDTVSMAALNFVTGIWQMPITLLAVPIATAVFPTFSELALEGQTKEDYESKLNRTLGISFFLIIPPTVFLFFMARPIVQLFFERGAFDANATALTASVVRMCVLGLFAYAVSPFLRGLFIPLKTQKDL